MTTQSKLDEYREYVREMAQIADGRVILNHDQDHATIVIAQIFASSTSIVKLLTGGLDIDVYGQPELVDSACAFMRNNPRATLQLAHEVDLKNDHPILSRFKGDGFLSRLTINRVSKERQSTYNYHFIVGDERNFRFQFTREECNAMVKFGAVDQAKQLSTTFDSLVSPMNVH